MGGGSSCYAGFKPLTQALLDLSYKPCDNILASLPGNTESIFLNNKPLVSLASEYFLISLPGNSTSLFPPIYLVVSGKLSGDSTDDEANHDFTMGPRKL